MFLFIVFFFFKQKTAYEMRISDWSSDVCSFRSVPGLPVFVAGGLDRGWVVVFLHELRCSVKKFESLAAGQAWQTWHYRMPGPMAPGRHGHGLDRKSVV